MSLSKNPVQRGKIVGSKWTARRPRNREKHFMVLGWVLDDNDQPTEEVELEAILTGNVRKSHWRDFESVEEWRIGWR